MGKEENIGRGNKRRKQVRKVRKGGWTAERRQAFLDHLAGCSNVTRAVKAVGLSNAAAYELRARDPAFAAAWDEALEVGYTTLESMMIERAAGAQGGYAPGETAVPDAGAMDSELALSLLRLRRAIPRTRTGLHGPRPRKAGLDELAEAILAKLEILSRRRKASRARGKPTRSS